MKKVQSANSNIAHPDPVLTQWDIQCMAYHEAGHAVCSFFSPEQEKLILITIDPTNEAFGMIRTRSRAHHNETEISLKGRIATLLAGRLAEQMFLNITTTSCIHDLASASFLAMNMVTKFGMSKKFPFYSVKSPANDEYVTMSDSLFSSLEQEAVSILNQCGSDAENILSCHQMMTRKLAQYLIQKKTMNEQEINTFFQDGERNA